MVTSEGELKEAIGGYFELELSKGEHYHKGALRLNTARNCLEYIMLAREYVKVYIPYYTCEVMLQPFHKYHIAYEFYQINKFLEPTVIKPLRKDEAFLYTNYFGVKQSCVKKLSSIYGKRLIVDNAQAFYAPRIDGIDTFYSPRKFFGVSDGAYLYTDCLLSENFPQDKSSDRMRHLLLRIEDGAEKGYSFFKEVDDSLDNMPILNMSNLTTALLCGINYDSVKEKRRNNFLYVAEKLNSSNRYKFKLLPEEVPMVYPYWCEKKEIRKRLFNKRIYVAQYWKDILSYIPASCIERDLVNYLLPLPIDQRLSAKEIDLIVEQVLNE